MDKEWMKEVSETLKALRVGQEHIMAKVDAMELRLAHVEGKVIEIDTKVQEIDGKVQEIDGKVQEIGGKVQEVNGKVTEISETQQRQERILEMLALRTIENEANIRDLKRIK